MEKEIKEQYKKESDGKTYLLLPKTREGYAEQMIRNAQPAGVLPMVKAEREDVYKYEITGRKTLAMTFERVPMNAEQVRKVLQSIFSVLEGGREYLLGEEHFLLHPEFIYLKIPEYEVTLCYYPEYEAPFGEQMGKLFEMLLNRVDYREEKAIALVYAMYMQLQEPDMTMERMRDSLEEPKEEHVQGTSGTEKPQKESKEREKEQEKEKEKEREKERRKTGFWERFRKSATGKTEAAQRQESLFYKAPQPAQVMEPPPEWGISHTRVISVNRNHGIPTLVSEQRGEDVELTKFPFYVGSLAGYADYVIENDTVSRFHAKFVKEGEDVFLVDLNSTNGTKVNGRMLGIQEKTELFSGDKIAFAEEEYFYYDGVRRM